MHAPLKDTKKQSRTAGEPFVWLTSVGLSLGLLMVAGLLAVIVFNGVKVFWPRRVVQIQIKADSHFEFTGTKIIAGELVKEQEKITPGGQEKPGGVNALEWQIYAGNKDVYGQSFVFIDHDVVGDVTYPADILKMERMEYGNAIGYPVKIKFKDGSELNAIDPDFFKRLAELNKEASARRKQITRIERNQIGDIDARMGGLQLDEKGLAADSEQFKSIEVKIHNLQLKYETLAKEATDLRAQQSDSQLVYKLPTGQQQTIPLGQLVNFYHPNQLTLTDKLGWFFHNVWSFLVEEPREANTEGGVFPAIFGTCVMTLLMSIAVMPFGVLAAIYLREYASQGFFVRAVRIAVNNLAGVPSIVFGVFGLGFFVYYVGGTIDQLFFSKSLPTPTFGTGGILWAALTLALMTVPVVIVATEEAIAAVPRGMKEASLACGASKWQTIQRIVIPSALPGILTGLILAMARGAGEVAPLMLVGVVKLAPTLPIDGSFPYVHLERKFMHLGFHIYDLGFQSPDSEAAKPMVFATTLLLIVLVVLLNLGAIIIRERLRRKYKMGAF